jgi:leucyl-tRNA synthetase
MSQRPVHEIESKWQKAWEELGVYRAKQPNEQGPEKFYGLIEFPYPSGEGLHVGHPRSYTAIDVFTRKKRMEGKNVLYPIGWDAFGLPTENYAIKFKIKPADATAKNVGNFTRQLKSLGFGFDWSREVNTTDPAYFKWTQWQFLQFVKAGLAYKAKSTINWCPKCKIGLANEEAQGGVCERCGTPVEKREKEQWMIGITKYAERLLQDLKDVDYLDKIKAQQINWIGKSEGAEIVFSLKVPGQPEGHKVTVFTTRPDTIFGATFLVISPELAKKWMDIGWQASGEVKAYVQESLMKPEADRSAEGREKTGVDSGVRAINPANGEEISVWIADYVLGGYGTGAIMAVPAHDERDFEFAKKFGLMVREVVQPLAKRTIGTDAIQERKSFLQRKSVTCIIKHWNEDKYLCLKWKANDWQGFVCGGIEEGEDPIKAAHREIVEETGYKSAEFVRKLGGVVHGQFYQQVKGQNYWSQFQPLYFELKNGDRNEIVEEEKALHDLLWLTREEVSTFVNRDDMAIIWNRFLGDELYSGKEGVLVNSDFLNGLEVAEAQKKMTDWLQEKGLGKKATTYKLRDWVFSRQRYWGEPIPLVHCEACAKKKQKVLLIHGLEGSAELNWFPWMKKALESRGFEVFAPTMTTSRMPVLEKWLEELMPFIDQMGEDDVIIGHSLGARTALHLLARAKKKIGSVYLVAPSLIREEERDWDVFRKEWGGNNLESLIEALKKFMKSEIDWDAVSQYAERKTIVRSSDDVFSPMLDHARVPEGWFVQNWDGFGHFDGREYPELLEMVQQSKNTGWIPVPGTELPVTLPEVEAYEPTDTGESPLAKIDSWVNTTCPKCGGPAKRETDTMPNWAGSSWYFFALHGSAQRQAIRLSGSSQILDAGRSVQRRHGAHDVAPVVLAFLAQVLVGHGVHSA